MRSKSYLTIFLQLFLILALLACDKQDLPAENKCPPCGNFSGELSGYVQTLADADTTFSNLQFTAQFDDDGTNYPYQLAFDISSLLGAPSASVEIICEGSLTDSLLVIPTQNYLYQGLYPITIDGSIQFTNSYNEFTAHLNISNSLVSTIDFVGDRQ